MSQMEAIVYTLLATYGAGIAAIAKWVVARMKASDQKHEECEAKNQALDTRIHAQDRKLAFLEACDAPSCPAISALRRAESFSLHPNQHPK